MIAFVKPFRSVFAIGLMISSTLSVFQVAAHASLPAVRDGGYVMVAGGNPTNAVEFVVGDNGTRVTEDGAACVPNAALVAQGVTSIAQQDIPVPQPLPGRISPGGSISYSATLTLTPNDTQSSVSVTTPFKLTLHFLRPKVLIANKTIAAVGTVWAPNVCAFNVLRFKLKWDPSARL
jgi:hypothetical protein